MISFANKAELKEWLQAQHINLEQWGKERYKTVDNLWNELETGESRLQADPPLRLLEVVQVIIHQDEHVLLEAAQTLEDGRRRGRQQLPSEKIHPGEDVFHAAQRCLEEELGVSQAQITIHPDTYYHQQREGQSPSYPGLRARYQIHRVEATVTGLPGESFTTREQSAGPGDPVQVHHWAWVPQERLSDM